MSEGLDFVYKLTNNGGTFWGNPNDGGWVPGACGTTLLSGSGMAAIVGFLRRKFFV